MPDIICITNRRLCGENFLLRIEKIAAARPAAIVLREKDLSPLEYFELAKKVTDICKKYGTECILHSFADIALKLGVNSIHLPLQALKSLAGEDKKTFSEIGASCHSVEDALCAERFGCTYITAGHIFETDCKKGVPPRGIEFLREVCASVAVSVFAIGGINKNNYMYAVNAGAKGVCVMSGAMTCPDPETYFNYFRL